MSETVEAELLALLGLRLTGFASADVVAEVVRLDVDRLHSVLHVAQARGWVQYREGRMTGWSLTPQGRSMGEQHLAVELDRRGRRDEVRRCYDAFLDLNGVMLAICTDWQMRDAQTLNDHQDRRYDQSVIDRLAALHERARPICDDLGQALDRFAGYEARLAAALERVQAGEQEWFTGVRIPSYHSVWF